MTGSRVVSFGHYQPARVMTNSDVAALVDTSDEWIRRRTGVETRHVAADDETVADMAARAAADALANGGVPATSVDLVIVATTTAVDRSPNTAARVADQLGMGSPAAIDVNVVCAGFTHALALADLAIGAGTATTAVVVGSEKLTAVTDWTDRTTCVLTGDGAGAMVLTTATEPQISPMEWGSTPELGNAVRIEGEPGVFAQDGTLVFRWATSVLPELGRKICARAGVEPDDLQVVVLHQANLRIIEPVAAKIGARNAIVAKDVVESGNTSAASVPLALSKLAARGKVRSGGKALLLGFGGGLSYAGQVITCP